MSRQAIVRLNGGLGNTLFQVGYGRLLMDETERTVQFDFTDISASQREKLVWLLGDVWIVDAGTALKRFLKLGLLPVGRLRDTQLRLLGKWFDAIDYQLRFEPLPDRGKEHRAKYFSGYFQDHRILTALQPHFTDNFLALVEQWRSRIRAESSHLRVIALHMRLGDYLTESAMAVHGVLPSAYYVDAVSQAIEFFRQRGEEVKLVLFTNDPKAAKERLSQALHGIAHSVFSDTWCGSDIDEFCAMAACDGHVIANSTFSYWPAGLSPYSQLRIAPLDWFRRTDLNAMSGQLFDARWHRI